MGPPTTILGAIRPLALRRRSGADRPIANAQPDPREPDVARAGTIARTGHTGSGLVPVLPILPNARRGGYRPAKKPGKTRHKGNVGRKRERSGIERRAPAELQNTFRADTNVCESKINNREAPCAVATC